MPVLPKGQQWEKIMDTFYEEPWNIMDDNVNAPQEEIPLEEDVVIREEAYRFI